MVHTELCKLEGSENSILPMHTCAAKDGISDTHDLLCAASRCFIDLKRERRDIRSLTRESKYEFVLLVRVPHGRQWLFSEEGQTDILVIGKIAHFGSSDVALQSICAAQR